MVVGFWDGGIILAISPSLLVVLLLPSESSLHDVPWLGATKYIYIYIYVFYLCSYRWLHYPTAVRSTGKPSTLRRDQQTGPEEAVPVPEVDVGLTCWDCRASSMGEGSSATAVSPSKLILYQREKTVADRKERGRKEKIVSFETNKGTIDGRRWRPSRTSDVEK